MAIFPFALKKLFPYLFMTTLLTIVDLCMTISKKCIFGGRIYKLKDFLDVLIIQEQ